MAEEDKTGDDGGDKDFIKQRKRVRGQHLFVLAPTSFCADFTLNTEVVPNK